MPVELVTSFLGQFGTAGSAVRFLLAVNVAATGLLVLVGVPLYFIRRDGIIGILPPVFHPSYTVGQNV